MADSVGESQSNSTKKSDIYFTESVPSAFSGILGTYMLNLSAFHCPSVNKGLIFPAKLFCELFH